jgi:hypothetical protein
MRCWRPVVGWDLPHRAREGHRQLARRVIVAKQHVGDGMPAWFAGTEGGHAIADVLFGDYNPSGKLPMSFPRSVGRVQRAVGFIEVTRGVLVRLLRIIRTTGIQVAVVEANGPLYPFGYGLSYTTFSVSDVTMSSATLPRDGTCTLAVTLPSRGRVADDMVTSETLKVV